MFNTLKRWCKENKVTATFVTAVITCAVGFLFQSIGTWLNPHHSQEHTASTVSTSTHTPTPTTASPSPTSPPPSPTSSPSPTNTPTPMPTTSRSPEWNPTLDQAAAKSDCGREGWRPGDWRSLGRSSETTALSQKVYNNGFKCELTKTLDDGSVDILVPKGANTFTVMGGQSDNSRNTNVTVTFEVINPLSNEVLDSASLPLGQTKEFRIDVSRIPRLTLKVLAEASAGESTKNEINVQPVWADPKFS